MDYFEDIMNGIHEEDENINEVAGAAAALGAVAAKGAAAAVATSVGTSIIKKNAVDKIKFNFEASIKKDIQRAVKIEMRIKKYKENNIELNKDVMDSLKEELEMLNKRIKKYIKSLDNKEKRGLVETYRTKCELDYGPTSLFYASISLPKTVKEAVEVLSEEGIFIEKKEESDSEEEDKSEDNEDSTDETEEPDTDSEEDSGIKSEILEKIEKAFDEAGYKINISKKNREAFLNNKRSFMTDANNLCLVLGKNDYKEKKKIIDDIVDEYKDDFKVTEDNYFTCFITVKSDSSLYVKNVKESVYSIITDDIDTYIESPYITEDDYMMEIAAREASSKPESSVKKYDVGNAGENTTPHNENDTPESEENCIGAMLPQCGSTDGMADPNSVIDDINKVNKSAEDNLDGIELPDDIEIYDSIHEYVNNLDLDYDVYVETAVGRLADKVKTNAEISKEAIKTAADKGIAKARYNKAKLHLKKEQFKDEASMKFNKIKGNFIDAEKRFRNKRKKTDVNTSNVMDAVAEKVFEKLNAPILQEAAQFNNIEVETFFSHHKKIKKACERYEKMNPSITPFSKLIEKPCIKSINGDMIHINPYDKKLAKKTKNNSKGYEYYDGKTLVFTVLKDVVIDSYTKVKPTFSLSQGFDLQLQYNKNKRISIAYSAITNDVKNHIDYYLASWMAKEKLGNYDILNWANYVLSSSNILAKEGFEMVDERDEAVLQLEKAMNENNLEAITLYENKIKYIDNREKKLGLVVTLETANMDAEIKPIIEELNRKGYKTKYSSAGHTKLRKKEDGGRDGVYYGKLYSDARIQFAADFDFPKPPKHWVWKSVDGCDYLDIIPQTYNSKDGSPDEAFAKWKANYMGTLRTWVDNLPDRSESEDKVVVKDTKGREKINE